MIQDAWTLFYACAGATVLFITIIAGLVAPVGLVALTVWAVVRILHRLGYLGRPRNPDHSEIRDRPMAEGGPVPAGNPVLQPGGDKR